MNTWAFFFCRSTEILELKTSLSCLWCECVSNGGILFVLTEQSYLTCAVGTAYLNFLHQKENISRGPYTMNLSTVCHVSLEESTLAVFISCSCLFSGVNCGCKSFSIVSCRRLDGCRRLEGAHYFHLCGQDVQSTVRGTAWIFTIFAVNASNLAVQVYVHFVNPQITFVLVRAVLWIWKQHFEWRKNYL